MEKFIDRLNEDYIEKLHSKLSFRGLTDDEIRSFVVHANPSYIELHEGQNILMQSGVKETLALVLTGRINIYYAGYDGTRSLLRSLEDGDVGGVLFSMLDYKGAQIQFVAATDVEAIMFSPDSIRNQELGDVFVQHKLLVNLIENQKNVYNDIVRHLLCLSKRTVRDKVLRFLWFCAEGEKSHEFTVPFSREELADYLAVDRASLSRTLGELKKEGVIDFNRCRFKILSTRYFTY